MYRYIRWDTGWRYKLEIILETIFIRLYLYDAGIFGVWNISDPFRIQKCKRKDIQNGYNNASVVCINLVQNVKRTINLVYRDTGYEKQKNVVVRQAAQSVSVRNAGEEGQTKRQEFTVRMDSRGQTCQSAGMI